MGDAGWGLCRNRAKVPGEGCGGENLRCQTETLPLANTLIVAEDESPILDDRCANGTAELEAAEGWNVRSVEEVACVKNLVTVEEVPAAMHLVGPGLRNRIDDRARGSAV